MKKTVNPLRLRGGEVYYSANTFNVTRISPQRSLPMSFATKGFYLEAPDFVLETTPKLYLMLHQPTIH